MRSLLSKCVVFFLVIASIVGVERLSRTLTDGFSYSSIHSTLPQHPEWNLPFPTKDAALIESGLSQPYRYLKSGSQSYAFISTDERYVIKFFKHKRWRLNPILEHLPLPPSLDEKRERWKAKKKRTIRSTFRSCKIAYTEFKGETGLIFIHLNKDPSLPYVLTVKDRLGFKHEIPLKEVEFVLQKKGIPTGDYLLALKEAKKDKQAKKALSELIAFTVKRAKKGYSDKDPHLIHNFGFIDGKVAELDVGGFYSDPKKDLHYFYSYELKKIHRKLLPWLEKNYPELVPHAQAEFSKFK